MVQCPAAIRTALGFSTVLDSVNGEQRIPTIQLGPNLETWASHTRASNHCPRVIGHSSKILRLPATEQPFLAAEQTHNPKGYNGHWPDSDGQHFSTSGSESHGESEEEASASAAVSTTGTKHKVVVMGAAKVGKSSIISQFLYGTFSTKYKRTVEEMHLGEFNVAGVRLTLEILDTAGSFEFPAMRALSISSADAFVLVYSAASPETFEEAKAIRDQILEIKGSSNVPIVVVGNKVDLIEDQDQQDSAKTFESIVTVDWENGFVETSAKENINVSQVFKELLSQAKVKYNLSPALRRRRRQSLPPQQPGSQPLSHPAIPSPAQLEHLQSLRERHANKRNSCVIS